jgi:hypothetical protein
VKNWYRKIYALIGVILTIGAFVALGGAVDSRYAKSVEVVVVSERLTEHELRVERGEVQAYIWEVEREFRAMYIEEYGDRPTLEQLDGYIEDVDPDTSKVYRAAKERLEEIDEELERLKEE